MTLLAQATTQPDTQNPQTAPGELFEQSPSVQDGSQADLLQDQSLTIQVPSEPAAEPAAAPPAGGINGWPLLIGVLIVLGLYWLWRYMKSKSRSVAPPAVAASAPSAPATEPVQPSPTKKPLPKKSKKSKSRRKKRARR